MVSKLISRNPWTTVGGMDWFSTPIDEMKHGNSYLDLPKSFKFYPSHTNKQFFRCYRPSLTKSNFFFSFYPSQISLRKFWLSRIGFSFENKKVMIEKVILYRLSRVCFFVCDMTNKRSFSSELAS